MPYPPLKMTASTVDGDFTPKGLVSLTAPPAARLEAVLVLVPEVAQAVSDRWSPKRRGE